MGWARTLGETLQEYRRRLDASGLLAGHFDGPADGLAGRAAYAAASPEPADAAEAARSGGDDPARPAAGHAAGRRILGWYLPERLPD